MYVYAAEVEQVEMPQLGQTKFSEDELQKDRPNGDKLT